jgi:hypothetical protein
VKRWQEFTGQQAVARRQRSKFRRRRHRAVGKLQQLGQRERGHLDANSYPQLMDAIHEAQAALTSAAVGFDTDRQTVLRAAEQELQTNIESLSAPSPRYN